MSLQDRATETSREAYRRLKQDGTIGARQYEALAILRKHGPATAKELAEASGADFPTIQKRMSELVDLGLALKLEPRKCRVSGRSVAEWRATEQAGFRRQVGEPATVGADRQDATQRHAKDPERGTLYRGGAKVGTCGCGTVNTCEVCGQCNAPGHQRCPHAPKTEVLQ